MNGTIRLIEPAMKIKLVLGMIVVALIGMGVVIAVPIITSHGEETKEVEREVTVDQVPAAVKATILKEAGGNKITDPATVEVGGPFSGPIPDQVLLGRPGVRAG